MLVHALRATRAGAAGYRPGRRGTEACASAPSREAKADSGQRRRAIDRRVREPLEAQVGGRRRDHDPVADLRAAGLQPAWIERGEKAEVLAAQGVDDGAVELLVADEMAQPAGSEHPDAHIFRKLMN